MQMRKLHLSCCARVARLLGTRRGHTSHAVPGEASTHATRQVQQSTPSYPTRPAHRPSHTAPTNYEKANAPQRPRTACHDRRPEGQRRACGAAGAGPGWRARDSATRASQKETHGNQPIAPEPPAATTAPKDSQGHAVLRVHYGMTSGQERPRHSNRSGRAGDQKRCNAKLNMHMQQLRVAPRACGHTSHAVSGKASTRATRQVQQSTPSHKASTSPEPHGTS